LADDAVAVARLVNAYQFTPALWLQTFTVPATSQ
jgi:hypothetical protein